MSNSSLTIRKSPFLFLRYLVLIEFFFAFLPLIAALIFPLQAEYNQTFLAQEISYNLLLTIVVTSLQVLIVVLSFFAWYLPVFQIDLESIAYRRAGAAEFRELIALKNVQSVQIRQGWLARRLDYGTLLIDNQRTDRPIPVKDIPNPVGIANQIEDWIAQRAQPSLPAEIAGSVVELIAAGEGAQVEFKASILWDYRLKKMNKDLSAPIIKNCAAFMNTSGGTILVGVADVGDVLGLDADLSVLKKPNLDGFELIFNNAFAQMIGVEYRRFIQLSFPEVEGKTICQIDIQPATSPVYFRHQGKEDFYIRAGNASQPLTISKVTAYIQSHFA